MMVFEMNDVWKVENELKNIEFHNLGCCQVLTPCLLINSC